MSYDSIISLYDTSQVSEVTPALNIIVIIKKCQSVF